VSGGSKRGFKKLNNNSTAGVMKGGGSWGNSFFREPAKWNRWWTARAFVKFKGDRPSFHCVGRGGLGGEKFGGVLWGCRPGIREKSAGKTRKKKETRRSSKVSVAGQGVVEKKKKNVLG